MDRMIQMAVRMLINHVMRIGIKKGVDMATRGKQGQANPNGQAPGQSAQQQRKIRQTANMMRRMGRF